MTSVNARLEAIEAGILVPFPQPEFSPMSIACSVSYPKFATEYPLQHSQPETSTLTDTANTTNANSTPANSTEHLTNNCIQLSSRKAEWSQQHERSILRNAYGEIFTRDELVASNLNGTKDKQKLDECKIRSIFSKYIIKSTSWSIRVKDSRQFIQIIVGITDSV